jgi:hypothetical protein
VAQSRSNTIGTLDDFMKNQIRRMIISGCGQVLLMLTVITAGSAGLALANRNDSIADGVAAAFTNPQISALIATASGSADPGSKQATQSLERLQQLLGVNRDVVLALLRTLDRPDIQREQSVQALSETAAQYHAITDRLAEITPEDPEGRRLVTEAQAALIAGHFRTTEELLRQLEDHEGTFSGDVGPADRPSSGAAEPTSSSVQHLIRAAEARTLIGEFALMKMRYAEATDHFQLAQQILALLPPPAELKPAEPPAEGSPPTSGSAEQGNEPATADRQAVVQPQLLSADATPAEPAGIQLTAETKPPVQRLDVRVSEQNGSVQPTPQAALNHPIAPHEQVLAAVGSDTTTANLLGAVITAVPHDLSDQPASLPSDGAVTKGTSAGLTLPANVVALLLRRGDASLALGDVSSARLLYARAAAGGDGSAATGVGKTYDPRFLLAIGARGIQGDPAAAAAWYRRAIELGDESAAGRLERMNQRSDR